MSLFSNWLPQPIKKFVVGNVAGAEKALLQRCRGDQEQVERLIAGELSRRPQLSRATAANAALDRWSRDR